MRPVKTLTADYVFASKLDMSNLSVALAMNLIGIALAIGFGWLFLRAAGHMRPDFGESNLLLVIGAADLLALILGSVGILILHELAHGFFFWRFTGESPKFGFHFLYAYAAAPDWYVPRNQFVVVGLAPLIIITAFGLILLSLVPISAVPVVLLALVINAAGSVGDLLVVGWLLTYPSTLMILDEGPKITLYKPSPSQVAAMSERWLALMQAYGVPQDAAREAFGDLVSHYSAGDRYYHNLDHVGEILDMVAVLQALAQDFQAIQLAVWYHDIIYDPRAKDNEARSAEYAQGALRRLGISTATIAKVKDLILATTTHQAAEADIDTQILVDADLSSLGADEDTFARQSNAIRKEYAYIPEAEYRARRVRLMSSFLERERIYQTEIIYASREAQARRNLSKTISALS